LSSSYLIYQAIFFSDASLRSQDDDPAICLVCGRLFNAGEVFTMNSTYNIFYGDEILIIDGDGIILIMRNIINSI
jgi:hypothetical protein